MIFWSVFLWLVVLLTCAVYLGAGALVLWMPCQGELLIGFCALGKLIVTAVGTVLLAVYLFLVFTLVRCRASRPEAPGVGTILLPLIGLAFLAIPVIFVFGVLRRDPNLQPYAIERLRRNGQQQVEFVSFSDNPVEPSQPDQKPGFIASGEIRVQKSGRYVIYPIRLIGNVPAMIMTEDGERLAQTERRYLQAGGTYQFDYFVEIQAEQVGADCALVSWKVLWQVESASPFPLYLFGGGSFAKVYPENSGDYAFVTHFNPDFQTGNYTVCAASSR